ncbi:MAG: ankyrin repeat domain-containing protein, partial [Nitrospinota bacterium]|nr:ankyrin repeat domain-containing protein [Nitrospinota bacterium]
LILASNRGHASLARQLLESGCAINEKNLAGNTALMEASKEGHLEAVKLLLEKGADPQIRNNKRELAHTMVAENRTDIKKVFNSHKGEWNWLSDIF